MQFIVDLTHLPTKNDVFHSYVNVDQRVLLAIEVTRGFLPAWIYRDILVVTLRDSQDNTSQRHNLQVIENHLKPW